MGKFATLLCVVLVVCLVACGGEPDSVEETSVSRTSAVLEGLIGPGDTIDAMSVEQGSTDTEYPFTKYPWIWEFCEQFSGGLEPGTLVIDCFAPPVSGLTLGFAWWAKESKIASNWDAMAYEMYIDDQMVDLDQFEWEEQDRLDLGHGMKERSWIIYLIDPSLGEHSFRTLWSAEIPVDDGFDVYPPGIYEYVLNFTIIEEDDYPTLTSSVNAGQHSYTSKEAGLNYLLYVPEEYGKDPQQEWPVILYLHGTEPGPGLDILRTRGALPNRLESESAFPFIVLSPNVDGDFEFWAGEEISDSVITLLQEIQANLSVDPQRIYLTGDSAGGNGTWVIGLRNPNHFAALVPVMGYYDYPFSVPENICDLKGVPVWAFHSANDEIVALEGEQMLVDALEECDGDVQFTVYPDAGHDADKKAYDTPELYTWLLEQKLE